ncbi:MAG: 2-oxoacid:acceptor oxidoreductase family protein [Deltaproteobacteria bacterium]|jgi:2-oxoglutarate ferredoxin oxidoreductase subunit gamma|nr:2-oxoacid:acceptor oxidoreductase family protein [Deltaproteobacteria bacterium]
MSAYRDVIMAGFGGQGVMLIGNLPAQAPTEHGPHTTFVPAYGVEMRGGTANCTVILDDEIIGSPVVQRALSTIVLNRPSLDKFQPRLAEGGTQIVNSSLIDASHVDPGIRSVLVPLNDMAERLGNARLLNMIALGAWVCATEALPLAAVQEALNRVISSHYAKLIPANAEALAVGYEFALESALTLNASY